MNEAIKLILSLSLSASILAVLLFAIKPLIRNKISKSIQYYIWIVVLIRLVLPFSFEASIMNNVFYGDQTPVAISIQSEENASNSSILPNVQENVTNGVYNGDVDHSRYFRDLFNQYVIYLWLLGIIIALTANLTGYARFSKHLKQANKPATDEENRILEALLNGRNDIRLVRNRFVTTPMLIGILKPYIIIPDINFDGEQLKNILLHEISHLRRFDVAVKWLTMIAASIHWFNPLMYFIKKEINHACELACDEAVIKDLNLTEKQAYCDTLISIASENKYPIGVLQATMSEEKETLKERLVAIMQHNKKSKIIILMSLVLLIAVISGAVVLGASIGKTNADITTDVQEQAVLSTTKSVSLKSDFDSLMQNPNFQKQDFEIIEMKGPVKVDKEAAIKTATAKETIGTYVSEQAKNITAVLVKYTNKIYSRLPGSDVVLQDLPVWIVTIHDVNILTSGGPKIPNAQTNNTPRVTVLGDVNVIIDANTGKWIETFSYSK